MSNERCAFCAWFEGDKGGEGMCRHHPPQIVAAVAKGGLQIVASFPAVTATRDWCSYHKLQLISVVN